MGAVYAAEDTRIGRRVALKLLPAMRDADDEAQKRFLAEARAVAALEHPHICMLYEFDEADGQPYIAMQLVEGETLKSALAGGPLSLERTREIIGAVAAALEAAHAAGIVHRDIKADNILLGRDGSIKLADFGIARLAQAETLTATNSMVGTPAYMSPEQLRAERATAASDQFSLAVVAYECATGAQPFATESVGATMHAIMNVDPDAPSARNADVPASWDTAIGQALRKDAAQRYTSVAAFAAALEQVEFRAQLASHHDETGELCHWQLPLSNYLEAWGDIRAADGTLTIQQPLIDPIFQSKSELELVSMAMGDDRSGYVILQEAYAELWGDAGEDLEAAWRRALHNGFVEATALAPAEAAVGEDWSSRVERPAASEGLELVIRPDSSTWDGRYNNNGWLQEMPRPISRLTWDNVAAFSPATAEQMSLRNGDVVTLGAAGNKVEAPVWILPGLADDVCVVTLGYGRTFTGHVGMGVGFDAYKLQSSEAMWVVPGVDLSKRGKTMELVGVQDHYSMEGRHLVRIANAQEYQEHPDFAKAVGHAPMADPDLDVPGNGGDYLGELTDEDERRMGEQLFESGKSQGMAYADVENPKSFFPEFNYSGYAWGMAIDLNACVGCNACMAACNSENNIPVVGKDQVAVGREMHWIRLDRYFEGDLDDPAMVNQPVTCMQCENAPCEPVCPVGATVHSNEGLNDMVYNRCVGTRYCSNNCPYKVRRFNFLLYQDFATETLKMARNPDVTVRSRGVMEKCTYCVQRINSARIESEREGRKIADGEILTACQQVCPAEAIVFGDINDEGSEVSRLKNDSRNYGLLEELNVQPRTSYLARVRNVNPDMPAAPASEHEADAHAEA